MANNQSQDLLDILFENRNRAYGAYVLRRSFEKNMRNALIGGVLLICFLFAIPYILTAIEKATEKPTVDVIAELGPPPDIENTPPPPPPPKVETPPPPVKATIKFVPPIVKKDEEVKEEKEIINVEDIKDEQIATKTVEGKGDQNVIVDPDPVDLGEKTEEVKVEKPDEPLTFVEAMPQFPGGEKELLTYFAQNIKYPAIARESGIQGRVILEFVVEKSGQVTGINVKRDIGGGCGKEAVRVANAMPAWKAGNQNGNPVRVKMNIPVVFKLE